MRINLNVDETLFDLIKADADKKNVSINMYVIGLLEKLYRQQPFNYESINPTVNQNSELKRPDDIEAL